MASSDSQIDKPQRGRPKRAELPDVNINTGAQSIILRELKHFLNYHNRYHFQLVFPFLSQVWKQE